MSKLVIELGITKSEALSTLNCHLTTGLPVFIDEILLD